MNWNVVKQLVEYGRSQEKEHNKKFRFTLTTNGVLLNDEIMEFCNREMSNVVLSLDGRPEVNDRMRPFRNGKGSYEPVSYTHLLLCFLLGAVLLLAGMMLFTLGAELAMSPMGERVGTCLTKSRKLPVVDVYKRQVICSSAAMTSGATCSAVQSSSEENSARTRTQ